MVKTRFSPSPTGMLHIGNVRAALFSALYAAKAKGTFLLRIEDTDLARSKHEFTEILQDDLKWLGLSWHEGPDVGGPNKPYWQSQRHEIYEQYYKQLETSGRAYPCFCTEQELAINRKLQLSRGQAPRYPGTCRQLTKETIAERIAKGMKPALRFYVGQQSTVEFTDIVKGPQRFNSDDIGDFIIRRAEGTSSFMFCNAIDDSLMGVTHVMRGEDHLTNTPRQLLILNALGMRTPTYGHLSLITGEDGAPLSKRHGSFSLNDLRQQGYLPLAVLNYLSRLGHQYEQQTLMNFSQLAEHFNSEKLSRAPARFDSNQLLHWQKESILKMDNAATLVWLGDEILKDVPEDQRELFAEVMRNNVLFPHEAKKWVAIFFGNDIQFSDEHLKVLQEAGLNFFNSLMNEIDQHDIDIKTICDNLKTKLGISGKKLFMPLRLALSGESNGPELIYIAKLLGKDRMKMHVKQAVERAGM